jgi:hypothetical protein
MFGIGTHTNNKHLHFEENPSLNLRPPPGEGGGAGGAGPFDLIHYGNNPGRGWREAALFILQ